MLNNANYTTKIAAVVVTYNRSALLTELIISLINQTRKIDRIYVIDNCSTDDTFERMDELSGLYKNVKYIKKLVNSGGSGGFHAGVKLAYEDGYDWIWIMDDDLEAYPTAIESLIKYSQISGCIHGRRDNFDGSPYYWQVRFNERIGYWLPVLSRVFKDSVIFKTNTGCFEGMFISKEVISKIGLPDAEFFITWDDAIYGWLASKVTQVIYVDEKVLKRKRNLKAINISGRKLSEASDLYRYYLIKNRPLVKCYIKKNGNYSPVWFLLGTIIILSKEIVRVLLINRSVNSIKSIVRGFVD